MCQLILTTSAGSDFSLNSASSLLWDFNGSDMAMNQQFRYSSDIQWNAYNDGDADAYTFTTGPNGRAGCIGIEAANTDAKHMRYVKMRLKNLSGRATNSRFYASINNGPLGDAYAILPFDADSGWREYVFDLTQCGGYDPSAWNGAVTYIRFDMGWVPESFAIDYVAFFGDEASAQAFRNDEVSESGNFGTLNAVAPNPTLVWDFGAGDTMHGVMKNPYNLSRYASYSGSGTHNGYYAFRASGGDPYISVMTPCQSANDVLWVKIKARSASSATKMQLYASCKDGGYYGNSVEDIPLQNDGKWHEYIHRITNQNWKNAVNWFRLDPLDGCAAGGHIDIDYIAFFADETAARAYQPGRENPVIQLTPGLYTYHLGDRLDFTTTLSQRGQARGMVADGVRYELRAQGRNGNVVNSNVLHYINSTIDLSLAGKSSGEGVVDRPYYKLQPTFTQEHNQMAVLISNADWAKLDTTKGILAEGKHTSILRENGGYRVVVANDIRSNEIFVLNVYTKDGSAVPTWATADGIVYSGNAFYALSNPLPEENVITLGIPASQTLGYAVICGTVATSTFNMKSGHSATDVNLAENAFVVYGETTGLTNASGSFELPAVRCVYGSRMRYMVDYNGISAIKEVVVPSKIATTFDTKTQQGESVRAVKSYTGTVMVQNFSAHGAHFTGVKINQGKQSGVVDALLLDGSPMRAEISVAGGEYVLDNQTCTERIKDVTVFFMDQVTCDVHASFSSNVTPGKNSPAKWAWVPDEVGGGTFILDIAEFGPNTPNDWTYGDVLMCRLTTDRKTVTSFFTGKTEMSYEAVSTGYAVISDPNYKPRTFEFNMDDMGSMVNVAPASDEDGKLLEDKDKRASFGSFPYIGEITAAVHVFHFLANTAMGSSPQMNILMSDLGALADNDSEDWGCGNLPENNGPGSDGSSGGSDSQSSSGNKPSTGTGVLSNIQMSVLVKFQETFYGGVRFMVGVIASYGGGKGYMTRKNPCQNARSFHAAMSDGRVSVSDSNSDSGSVEEFAGAGIGLAGELDKSPNPGFFSGQGISNFGGPHFQIRAYVGVYFDFGWVELKQLDDKGVPQRSHDGVLMGYGGFIGFGGTVGYSFYLMIVCVPAYFVPEAGIDLTVFLGSSADPNKTLDEYMKYDDFQKTDRIVGEDFSFNFDFRGKIFVSGSIGVGLYKVLGVRVTGEVVFEFGYGNKVTDWYPQLFDSGWGYVYATALIHQDPKTFTVDTGDGNTTTDTMTTVRWSKPYRLTRDEEFNDGLALALDEEGRLLVVHNRFSKLTATSEEEVERLVQQGKIGLTRDKEGNTYAASLSYNSPVTLSVTRFEEVGSLEATAFEFSDTKPVGGETVSVTAAIENVGFIDAQGYEAEFYEYKDGVQGRKICDTITSDQLITVNTAQNINFDWTVPQEGPAGYSIQAVIRERRPDGAYFDATTSYSETFIAAPDYKLTINKIVQDGDRFHVSYSVANRGNAPAPEGTTLALELVGLYGDLDSELYGNVKDNLLFSADVTDKLPAKTAFTDPDTDRGEIQKSVYQDEQWVTIPASVFRYCGYDAVVLTLSDADGNPIGRSSQMMMAMDAPMNLSLNEGKAIGLEAGASMAAPLTYNTTVFLNDGPVVYTMADPSIAEVDDQGQVTGLANGSTELTATLLPSGRRVSIPVSVSGGSDPAPDTGDDDSSSSDETSPTPSVAVTPAAPTDSFVDVPSDTWYSVPVAWAVEKGITKGTDGTHFSPDNICTRSQMVTFLWRAAGSPEPKGRSHPFTDVGSGSYYEKAVLWAVENGITNGVDGTHFAPENTVDRSQTVTFLYRFTKAAAEAEPVFEDVSADAWYASPVAWAAAQGITQGIGGANFGPVNPCTRAQIVTFLYRLMAEK